jgi:hypothetical protein
MDNNAGLPVLTPDSPARAARWEGVLNWYEGAAAWQGLLPVRNSTVGSRGILFFLGRAEEGTLEILEQYALVLGFVRIASGDMEAAVEVLRSGGIQSCLILGHRKTFTYETTRILSETVNATGTPTGFLPFHDKAGLTFMLAKSVMADGLLLGSVADMDSIDGFRDDYSGRHVPASPDRLSDANFQTLIVAGHGDGTHVHTADIDLCGLAGDLEFLDNGQVVPGCSAVDKTCKRSEDYSRRVVYPRSIRMAQFVVLSCAGFSLAGDSYPSDRSVVLSSLEGYAASVIASFRRVAIGPTTGVEVSRLQSTGATAWEIASFLNSREPGLKSWVVAGDPLYRAPQMVVGADRAGAVSRPVRYAEPAPAAWGADERRPQNRARPLSNRGGAPVRRWISAIERRTRWAAMFEQAVYSDFAGNNKSPVWDASVRLAEPRVAVESIIRKQWRRWCADSDEVKESTIDVLKKYLGEWDCAMSMVVESLLRYPHSQSTILAWQLSDTFYRRDRFWVNGRCAHCNAEVLTYSLVADEIGLPERWADECQICGWLTDKPASCPELLQYRVNVIDGVSVMRVTVDARAQEYVGPDPTVVVGVYDRAKNKPVAIRRSAISDSLGQGALGIALPPDMSCDAYVVDGVLVGQMEVYCGARKFVKLPTAS